MAEQGYIVTNDQTGEQAWWDGQNLTPVKQAQAETEKAQIGKLNELDKSTQNYKSALESRQPDAPMKLSDFTNERQRSAIDESQRGLAPLKAAVIPTAAAAASMIPGVGTLAGAALQAGGTAVNQALGYEPYSLGEIAKSGAIPLVIPGLSQIPKLRGAINTLGQEAGKFFNPGAYRKAATGAGMEILGAEPNVVTRANMVKESTKAFAKIRANPNEVPTDSMRLGITNAINDLPTSNQPEKAIEYLNELHAGLAKEPTLPYSRISKELDGMYAKAQEFFGGASPNNAAGHAVMEARQHIIGELGKVSKDVPEAYELYKKEQSVEKISKMLNMPKPDVRLGELFLKDSLVKQAIPEDIQHILMKVAEQAASAGTLASPYGGATAKVFNAMVFPFARMAASKTGQYLLRQTFQDGVVTLPKLNVIAQFGRAYIAQGRQD